MPVSKTPSLSPEREQRRQADKAQRHSERRLTIMRSAKELLVTQGIDRFTVAEVAQASSLSKPSLYYYFASKEALVLELALESLQLEYDALTGAIRGAESGVEVLVRLVRTRIDFFLSDVDAFRIVHIWAPALGLQDQIFQSSASKQVNELLTAIGDRLSAERKGLSARPDIQQLPQVAWALSQGILVQGVTGATHPSDREQCRVMRDIACRWLLDSLIE